MEADRKRRPSGSPDADASDAVIKSSDHTTDSSDADINHAAVAAGYIVGERPALLRRDNYFSVINNQKCALYDCKDARKMYDMDTHSDMVVSCDSCEYNDDIDLLFIASYDGILSIYMVKSHAQEQPQHVRLVTMRLCYDGLLSVRSSKSSGELIYVYAVNGPNTTVVVRMSLDYDALIHTEEEFDVNVPIDVFSPSSRGASDDKTENTGSHSPNMNVVKRRTCESDKRFKRPSDDRRNVIHDNNDQLYSLFVKEIAILCSLPSRVDVFATHAELEAIAFAIGKTAIVLNMKMKKIVFFECFSSISCMAFFTANSLAVGDSRGRIAIYNMDPGAEAQNADNLVVACEMPDERLELSAGYFKKILLALHSSSADPRDLSDYTEFRNFKKIKAAVTTLIWHAHGVNCLTFNSDGSVLLSGGEEGVLVVWYLNSGAKRFVTRIGSAIFHILCQRDHGMYILCCEANEIMFVDPFALCIRKRVTGITVPINIGMKVNKELSALSLPQGDESKESTPAGNTDINVAHVCLTVLGDPAVPLIQHWPTNLTDSLSHSNGENNLCIGGNVAIYARSNKLQIYNYIQDREVGSLLLKNVNILSRQDDEFGQDWDLEELIISDDGQVVVTVQSRNVLNKLGPANERGGYSGTQPEFEHEVLTNNRKGLLKFWIKQQGGESDGSMLGNYMEHTKISNPHSHKTTSIRQLNSQYAFLTTSLDSEFKLWHMIRKRILKSDNLFETYRAVDITDSDYQVDIANTDSYVWVCVAVGSYKNMPCFSSSLTDSGRLLAISHDAVITFWKLGASHNTVELVGAVPLPCDEKINVDQEGYNCSSSGQHHLTFLCPNHPRILLYSKKSRLCMLDVSQGTLLWDYPISRGQVVDKVVYSAQMPNLVAVSTSFVDEVSFGCSGTLEMFWLSHDSNNALTVERFYLSHREISRVILNMCITPAAFFQNKAKKRTDKIEAHLPVLQQNTMISTLVLLTANFNLETVLIVSDLYGGEKPKILDIRNVTKRQALPRKALQLTRSQHFDLIAQLMSTIRATKDATGAKKKVKYNLSDQLCKDSEWKYRIRCPMPKSVLGAVVDPGCPTSALPSPNVVLNRMLHLVTVKHQKQS